MKVVFFLVGDDQIPLAEVMLDAARRAMRNAEFVQLTDELTPGIVDNVVRLPWDGKRMMMYRLQHLSHVDGMFIAIEPDVYVQQDLSFVFRGAFDVALTRRHGIIMHDGEDIVAKMPFNCGVLFSRNPDFWKACYEYCLNMPEKEQSWFDDQVAVKAIYERGNFTVLELPCNIYNYTPAGDNEDVSMRAAVHYKGAGGRKQWMLNRMKEVA